MRRIAAVVFGLALGLLLIEALLQVGALYVRLSGVDPSRLRFDGGSLRVLALGDSNTYGLFLEDRLMDAYPMVLESEWRKRVSGRPIQVINVGVPGTNSSRLRKELPRLLATFRPDVITVMIGVNDFWTEPIRLDDEDDSVISPWRISRLYRFLYMMRRVLWEPTVEVEFRDPKGYRKRRGLVRYDGEEFDLGWTRSSDRPVRQWRHDLTENLNAIREGARAAGTIPVFLTYASEKRSYRKANQVIRIWAERAGVPIVDSQSELSALCRQKKCGDLYFSSQHPTAKAHAVIGRVLLQTLADLEPIGGSPE